MPGALALLFVYLVVSGCYLGLGEWLSDRRATRRRRPGVDQRPAR